MVLKDDVIARPAPGEAPKPARTQPGSRRRGLWQRLRTPLGKRRNAYLALAVLAGAIFAAVFLPRLFKNPAADYVTAEVERGSVEDTVTALGSLQPLNYVDVGAQVSGQIQVIHVDVGDQVKKGDLLVEIDPRVQQQKVDQSRSQLAAMQAQLLDRQATLRLRRAEAARQTRLRAEGANSLEEYDTAIAAAASAQAAAKSQEAQIAQARSQLTADETTLGYSRVIAPMDGTVVSLPVKQGQTINASQQAPTILRIADLSTMTVTTQVSEADVSRLRVGMPAYFTTLGDPNTRHEGSLRQILPTPEIQNNVVLFNVLFDVANPDRSLMTQMTAQVFFVVASARNVLTVPVSALQMPQTLGRRTGQGSGRARNAGDSGRGAGSGAAATGSEDGSAAASGRGGWQGRSASERDADGAQRPARRGRQAGGPGARRFVLVASSGGKIERRPVVVGVTNRISAEIKSGLSEGESVVVGRKQAQKASASSQQRSPLTPQPFGGPGGGRRGG